jgi:cellulose synthase/poly-beta-1,6-N-acetylglucosamine synthase-like glycosyltransferase
MTAKILVVLLVFGTLFGVSVVVVFHTHDVVLLGYWFIGVFVIVFCFSAFIRPRSYTHLPAAPGRVLAIIPAYNESSDEAVHGTVRALLRQSRSIDQIVVIDDGSAVPLLGFDHPRVTWLRQANTGKRGAQVTVLRRYDRADWDFILTVDSDSEPYPDAVEQLLRAFTVPTIWAATGMIYIRNFQQTWVSRAADMDIGMSCVMMRASRSYLGALETTSGALAMYRSDLLYDHLDAYAVECGTGDDRWLSLRALLRGEVVGVAEAGVVTDMPVDMHGTFLQRLRWARSWWWMIPFVLTKLKPRQLISPLYGMVQLVVTPLMMLWIAVMMSLSLAGVSGFHRSYYVLLVYAVGYLVVRYGAAALYLMDKPNSSRRQKLVSWLVGTPASVWLNIVLLMPTRYYALAKLKDNRWRTREIASIRTDRELVHDYPLVPVGQGTHEGEAAITW